MLTWPYQSVHWPQTDWYDEHGGYVRYNFYKKQHPPPVKLHIFYAHFIQASIAVWRIFVCSHINIQAPCHPHHLGRNQLDCDAENRRLHTCATGLTNYRLLMWVWSSATHVFQYSDFFHEIRWKIFTIYNFHILNQFLSDVTVWFLTQRIQYKSMKGKKQINLDTHKISILR
jgi:hypothetical protein